MPSPQGTRLPALKRIAAIHDLSGVGKCSLTVAIPVISASGVECSPIPTALLSTHTGEFNNYTLTDLSGDMLPIARHWREEGIGFDGIYSGYLASPEQSELLEAIIRELRDPNTVVVVDTVMADNGEYYRGFDGRMCAAFRKLCRVADVLTPNITEAALLTGAPYMPAPHDPDYIGGLLRALLELGPSVAAITGAAVAPGEIGIAAMDSSGGRYYAGGTRHSGVFYGTGDIFASAFAALLVRGAETGAALEAAAALVRDSIARSVERCSPRRLGVDFEGALPAHIRRVEKIFKASDDYTNLQ